MKPGFELEVGKSVRIREIRVIRVLFVLMNTNLTPKNHTQNLTSKTFINDVMY